MFAVFLLFVTLSHASDLRSSTIFLRVIEEPETLDWNKAHTSVETHLLVNLMEGLASFDEDMKIVPALAKSWKVSPDGKTYTFYLRNGVNWSDGVPLRARDFVYSWRRLLLPATAASYAYMLYDVVGAENFNKGKSKDFGSVGIHALDDSTFQVKLSRRSPHWINVPTFWVTFPLRKDVVEKYGDETSSVWASPGKMVTVGPYTLVSHEHDLKLTMRSNPNYFGEKSKIENVVFQIVRDDSTALTLYESGRLDFLTDISSLDLKRLAGRADLKSFPYYKTGYLGMVLSVAPFQNAHFRRAIAMAIDKNEIGKILNGSQLPATSWIPRPMAGHSDNVGLPFDPVQAKEELRLAGTINTSKPIQLVVPNAERTLILAQYIQQQLKKNIGLNVEIQQFDHKTFRAQIDLHVFPMFLLTWSADFPDPDNFASVFLSDSGNNRTNWKSKKYDDWVQTARAMQDSKGRDRLYGDAQRLLEEQDPAIVPLYYEPNVALVHPRIRGLELNPLNELRLREVTIVQP